MTTGSRDFPMDEIQADVVVVGAGPAGLCAAVAAARSGASTVLVTDRPVFGGNCSGEVGVGMNGAAYSPFNLWARETGIAEELRNRNEAISSGDTDSYWTHLNFAYFDIVASEPNLRFLLNTTITGAECAEDGRIRMVEGVQLRAERRYRLCARFFIDCSGDGVVGGLSGADFRMGREARSEFGESLAPEVADSGTMGATLLWRTRDVGRVVEFHKPEWAIDVSQMEPFVSGRDRTRTVTRLPNGDYFGFWWAEYGGQIDSIHDDQEVLWHLRRLAYGMWDYIRNSGKYEGVETQELHHMAVLAGKRESRRLLGPVILTENDWRQQRQFEDAIGYTGWPVDIHPPMGYLSPEPGCSHDWLPGPSDIPLRALYSRNVPNLFFAGRCLSATHVALGSPRVIATTAVMGQATGAAAALCLEKDRDPGALEAVDIRLLQQRLLRADQSILGLTLEEPEDLARQATVSASSTRAYELLEGEKTYLLGPTDKSYPQGNFGVIAIVPAAGKVDAIALRFQGKPGTPVRARVYLADRPQNYRPITHLCDVAGTLDNEGWARFALGREPGEGLKFLLFLPPQEGLALLANPDLLPGAIASAYWHNPGEGVPNALYARDFATPLFRMEPEQPLLAPTSATDGHIRPLGLPHLWSSAAMEPGQPEWLELTWPREERIGRVEVVFDTQLQGERVHGKGSFPTLVRDYTLTAERADGSIVTLAQVRGNMLRLRAHTFPPEETRRLRLTLEATHGSPYAAVYCLRAYAE